MPVARRPISSKRRWCDGGVHRARSRRSAVSAGRARGHRLGSGPARRPCESRNRLRLRCAGNRDIRWVDSPRTAAEGIPVAESGLEREGGTGIGGEIHRFHKLGGRSLQSGGSRSVRRGAPLLLVLYLAWIVSPALHQIRWHLANQRVECQPCPAEDPDWRIFSHLPDQPCSDPDHHHHRRPVHDEDHCLLCRLSGFTAAVLPLAAAPLVSVQLACRLAPRPVVAPPSPAPRAISPRAPPQLASA